MAKVIKRGPEGDAKAQPQDAGHSAELTQISEPRRLPIIERETYEARGEAQVVRERAQAQADDIVAEAEQQAQALIEAAEERARQIAEQAHADGLQQGIDEGAAKLLGAILAASQQQEAFEAEVVPQLSQLALHIARKVLGRELEFHPEAVVQLVKQALGERARLRREVALRLHPDDLAVVRQHKPELLDFVSRAKDIVIREDRDVAPHGVIIETEAGTIDAQLETQLRAIERAMQEVAP